MTSEHEFTAGYEQKPLPSGMARTGFILLGIGIVLTALTFFAEPVRAVFNSVILFMFISSIGVCSIFLIALEYLVGAVWSVPFRRTGEFLAVLVFIAPLLALPGLLNMHDLFHWTHIEAVQADPILQSKSPYLNTPFFIIRFAGVFILWFIFYLILRINSKKQDIDGDQKYTHRNAVAGAVFMPVLAITITILAVDWMMSIEPHWFSTIFGVYYFSGSLLAALAAIVIIAIPLNKKGYLAAGIGPDHYYSLGALMFGFVNFWAYIAFSQFLLIWYANIPEETFWYLHRTEGTWNIVSLGMILIRFLVPYVLLLSQPSKKDPKRLTIAAWWILFAHWYDLYWLIMPGYDKHGAVIGWQELGFPVLAAGIVYTVFYFAAKNKNLIPVKDPKLKRAVNFKL